MEKVLHTAVKVEILEPVALRGRSLCILKRRASCISPSMKVFGLGGVPVFVNLFLQIFVAKFFFVNVTSKILKSFR